MTQQPTGQEPKHCEHEDYCHTYTMRRMNDIPEGLACPYPCEHYTRSRPYSPAPDLVTAFTKGHIAGAKSEREEVLDDIAQYIQKHKMLNKHGIGSSVSVIPLIKFISSLRVGKEK